MRHFLPPVRPAMGDATQAGLYARIFLAKSRFHYYSVLRTW